MPPDDATVERRFWAPLGEGHRMVDQDGFLLDPDTFRIGQWSNVKAETEETLRDYRCLTLLGEPGMGKSTFLDSVSPLLPVDIDAEIMRFDLAEFGSEDRLFRKIFESPTIEHWNTSTAQLCLILDGFDDAQTRIPQLGSLVANAIEEFPIDRLWLRIACRTADWPQSLSARMAKVLANSTVELLPLRWNDVAALAAGQGVDPELFLQAIRARRVGALAARPLTLKFLLRAFKPESKLPDSAEALYRMNLAILCDEQNLARRAATHRISPPGELYAAARRIGAASVFGGVTSVWIGPLPCPEDEDVSAADDLAGGEEPAAISRTTISPSIVRDVLRTSLFNARGNFQMGWSHTSFQDFLAADWIMANELSNHQIRTLLVADDGGAWPQTIRTAAWMIALAPDRFHWLIEADPEAFVGQIEIPSITLRKTLVDGLFTAAEAGHLVDKLFTRYNNLHHAGLFDQLKLALDRPGPARRIAIRIARDCSVRECVEMLASIALDPASPNQDRVSAGWALTDKALKGNLLVPLVEEDALRGDDTHNELLTIALLASWPHAITTAQVLEKIAAFATARHNSNVSILVDDLSKSFTADDLAAATTWLQQTELIDLDDYLAPLRSGCLRLCAENLDDPFAADAAARTLLQQLLRHDRDLWSSDLPEVTVRRRLALLVAKAAPEPQMASLIVYGSDPLLTSDDFLWLFDQADPDALTEQAAIHQLLPDLVDPTRMSHVEAVLSINEDSFLRPTFASWLNICDLTDPNVIELRSIRRKMWERRSAQHEPQLQIDERIVEYLDQFDNGDSIGYWYATRLVCVRPKSRYFNDEHQPDLTVHPRWDRLPQLVRDRFLELAPKYLATGRCSPEQWLTKEKRYYPAEAAYRALLLLLKFNRQALDDLAPTVWKEWAPIIISWPTTANGARPEDKGALLSYAVPHARTELRDALLAVADAAIRTGRLLIIQTEAKHLWDVDLQAEFSSRLTQNLSKDVRSQLATIAMEQAPEVATTILVPWLSETPERALTAAALLLTHRPAQEWPTLYNWMESEPDLADQIFLDHADSYGIPLDFPATALTDLYIWLSKRFPRSQDPQIEGAHWVSPRESLAHFRDRILDRLRQAGTKEAVMAIDRIMTNFPDEKWLRRVYAEARAEHREAMWTPNSYDELRALAADHSNRLVRTEKDLLEAVADALEIIQRRLTGETPESHLLWDTASNRPKSEDEISDYLRNRLTDILSTRRIIVNREVQVRRNRPSGIGERTDLRIDAFTAEEEAVTLIVEAKFANNKECGTALPEQLVNRYMADVGTNCGIFLVISTDDPRSITTGSASQESSVSSLQQVLQRQADEQASEGRNIRVFYLNIPYLRPISSSDS